MKTMFALLLSALVLVLAGCNTVQGVGKDVRKVGEVVESAAKR
ncbi:entericidin A/B family lipoprotein [Noviherbaspirillum sp. CPCC 100848]|uniref:Entericidin A/B family lipoprotein n=1 Tax=Noviherbaspirillum album TaxID=3080276 RepID=A0ABU6JBN2_9BURK|nr:entericidin A/B family lipoprotein [Noviherbaspirillum sp. CPCC 100848]MEC4721059.1 entericidin A/B family lipoprotein [Noviherbaspirillum sp. CPCC 100848]